MGTSKIRTLVVDDSVFMRTVLQDGLGSCGEIEVIGSAQNGLDALEKIEKLKPDVVTLDIEMPGLTGLEVLERVMNSDRRSPLGGPLPIVMVSTKTQQGAEMTFDALDLGAFDYVAKPLADKSASLQKFKNKVANAVKAAYASNRTRVGKVGKTRILRPRSTALRTEDTVVAIGISAGGPATRRRNRRDHGGRPSGRRSSLAEVPGPRLRQREVSREAGFGPRQRWISVRTHAHVGEDGSARLSGTDLHARPRDGRTGSLRARLRTRERGIPIALSQCLSLGRLRRLGGNHGARHEDLLVLCAELVRSVSRGRPSWQEAVQGRDRGGAGSRRLTRLRRI